MKATQVTTYRSLQNFLDRTSDRLSTLQLQAATGKKLNRPSDDPTAISPVLSARTQIQASDRYIETIATGLDRINNMDGYLDGIGNTMIRLKEIAIAAVNGAVSDQDLQTYAEEVKQLRQSLIADANAQVDGKYLFAGFSEKTEPFSLNPDYPGNPDYPAAGVAQSVAVAPPLSGPAVLLDGDTPVTSLVVPNQGTWTLDTTNPAEYALTFTPVPGFVGNASISYTPTGDIADAVTIDYSPPSPVLYNGDQSDVQFEIAPNELITVNLTGQSLMMEPNDIFSIVTNLIEALESKDQTAVQGLIDPLEDAANQIRGERSLKGNIGKRLEVAGSQMEKIKIDMEAFRSRFEDADIIETITQLQQQEQSFQAALSVTGRVSSLSILDYI
ncbi:flagellar hook-associated protein FlgL [Pelovirga terrestris]|uniref:Flagellar hook-associated protein FlgL n=1 Tax=Pelovirga terrestris TaxID=2771352 RepID=A0A8J6QYI9_9BACT|nr:flagellar hook-associated protein FlgL [Pelovirga terrestris]MBD1401253.1 flagellar hook-associated protein FlgL [Pelovirga terrestris]